jgi:uncharacterized membrane protein YgdD (TMEM256/DUF423 family)
MQNPFLFIAAISAFLGVAFGAFGAHGLKHLLSEQAMEVYKTAVSYQMWHALAIGLIAVLPKQRLLYWAGLLFALGILLFSGSLYLLVIFDLKFLGLITPLGGVAFLAAWGLLAFASLQKKPE